MEARIKDKNRSSRSKLRSSSVNLKSDTIPRVKITDVDKQRIIAAYENHENYEETAQVLGISRNTAYSIIRR